MSNDRGAETAVLPPKSNTGNDQDQVHFGNPLHVLKNLTFTLIWPCGLWEPTPLKHHGENQVTCCLGKFWHLSLNNQPHASQEHQFWHQSNVSSVLLLPVPKYSSKHSNVKGFLLLLCHLSTYHPAWLMSETETIKSNRGVWPKLLKCVKTDFTLSLKHLIFVRSRNRI